MRDRRKKILDDDEMVVDLAGEFISQQEAQEQTGKTVEGGPFDFEVQEDEMGELKEALLRNAEGVDPAPDVSDEELLRRFMEAHDA